MALGWGLFSSGAYFREGLFSREYGIYYIAFPLEMYILVSEVLDTVLNTDKVNYMCV